MAFREGEQVFIIENNSRVTPVHIVHRDGDFYTIEFSDFGRISLRKSRLFQSAEEAERAIRKTPFVRRQIISNGYTSPYRFENSRNPYGV